MTALVIGVDCSTTACKAIAWDDAGNAHGEGRAPIALDNPAPDAWQQDARSWWQATEAALAACVAALGPSPDVRALCVTHQRETFVVGDERGEPLHPALVWMDARCRDQVRALTAALDPARIHELSGKPPCITPSLYKLRFLLDQAPEIALRKPRLYDVHAFLVERLTGRFATSLASADPLGLIDMRAERWSSELGGLVDLGAEQLPELVRPGDVIGRLHSAPARACGLPAGLPVIAGAGDGQCAGLGAGIVAPGRAYLNLGTAVVSGVLSRTYQIDRAFRTLYGAAPGTFFLETDLKGGTFTLNWLLERLLGKAAPSLADLEASARELAPGADGLMLVPYWAGVMNPYWDDDASGIAVGWHGGHGPAHVYRAILEGIAFEQRLHTSGVEQASGPITELVVMGGGAQSDLWCQILADVLEKPIVRSKSTEATALGAGVLAAAAAGLHPDLDTAAAAMTGTGRRFTPGQQRDRYAALYRDVYARLYPALAPALGALSRLRRA